VTSWQPQFQINGKWLGNGFRFSSQAAALDFANAVASRRALHGDCIGSVRAVPAADPPNQADL
jgi:hypothetical protein